MNQKKSKLLRKIARLAGRSDQYIKKEFHSMDPSLQRGYLAYMRENLKRIEQAGKNPTPSQETIISDIRISEGKEA